MGPRRHRGHSTHTPATVAAVVLLAAAAAVAALLAACGGSSGGAATAEPSATASSLAAPSAASSPTTSPGGVPLAGTPKQAIEEFWQLVDADAYAALAAATAPGASGLLTAESDDIESVELLRVVRVDRQPGAALVQVDVRVVPASAATPWGAPGRHTLFVKLLQQAPGEWLVVGWATSP